MIIDDKLMKFVVFQKRTVYEVRQKCLKLGYAEEYIDEIIDYLEENEYLNDKKFVEKYIKNIMRLKISSIYEMKVGLLKKGVPEDYISDYINSNQEELIDFEYESAKKLVQKKTRQVEELEKIKKYMLSKGYSYDSINEGIDNFNNLKDNKY
ncbi:MAG: regulatory protein RecX [Clostridia bacterium]|nr:regulatory protein RecX [Clostridia bacterium]